jgi:endonuclease YncB( thermonuclease family)
MRHSITARFIVAIALIMASAAQAEDLITARVVGVTDGDSITVLTPDQHPVVLKLHGIDCPEMGQPYGEQARQFTQNLCFGKIVLYRIVGIDIFEQTLAIVSLEDGRELNLALLEAGLAWHLERHSNRQDYQAAEQKARKAGVGLWAMSDPIPPWEWRREKTKAAAHEG